jgi:hypothetical protein
MTVVGSDTGAASGMLVREPKLGLRGRPDYVFEPGAPNERRLYPLEARLYPLEARPTRRGHRVYESDELQVGAYLLALRGAGGPRGNDLPGSRATTVESPTFQSARGHALARCASATGAGSRKSSST